MTAKLRSSSTGKTPACGCAEQSLPSQRRKNNLARRLREFPPLKKAQLWPAQIEAIHSLEKSFRLIRLERRFDADVKAEVTQTTKGQTLSQIAKGILDSVDPDQLEAKAKEGKPAYYQPSESELSELRASVVKSALSPLASNPDLRNLLKQIQSAAEQTIDIISKDALLYAGPVQKTAQSNAQLATSFRDYIETHGGGG